MIHQPACFPSRVLAVAQISQEAVRTMDKSVSFTTAELVALDTAAVWFVAELRARIDRANSEVDREMSADQMKHLLDARKKIHDARHST
jgi:hypothetical protein